jgi:gluconokinase
VFLDVPRADLEHRVTTRTGHFVSPTLLDSQLALLEPPGADERVVVLQSETPLAEVVARCRATV